MLGDEADRFLDGEIDFIVQSELFIFDIIRLMLELNVNFDMALNYLGNFEQIDSDERRHLNSLLTHRIAEEKSIDVIAKLRLLDKLA